MRLLERASAWIAPYSCLVCGREGRLVCLDCQDRAIITKRPTCYSCNALSEGGRTCDRCRRRSPLAGVTVASHYDGQVKELILKLKFEGAREAAGITAQWLAPLLDRVQFDLVVAVPPAAGRYRRRGYNQAELIATELAARLALPYSNPLIRLGNSRQLGQARRQRLEQARRAFGAASRSPLPRRVLLVDDVITTGATMAACAEALKQAGAKSVWGAAVAKH
jgi:competence protein ComFC